MKKKTQLNQVFEKKKAIITMIFKSLQTLDRGTLHINFFRVVLSSCRSVAPSLNVLIKRGY